MESDDLVTKDEVAWCNVCWDLHGVGEVAGCVGVLARDPHRGRRTTLTTVDVVRAPLAWRNAAILQTNGVELEEVEVGLGDLSAITIAASHVVDDRAVMAIWPGVPDEVDGAASGHWDVGGTWSGLLVADDIARTVSIWGDKTIVLVLGVPPWSLWLGAVDPIWCGIVKPFPARADTGNVTVGRDGWQDSQCCCGDCGESEHPDRSNLQRVTVLVGLLEA